MSMENFTKLGTLAFSLMLGMAANGTAAADANIIIVNLDGPGEGFNDPTPASPVGGNKGKTLGAQRLIAFQHAAKIWGETLDSNVTIRIQAAFNPLAPGVLGSAGAISVSRDFSGVGQFPGAEFADTWYGAALANKRAGVDLEPGTNDINAQFNSNFNFYLGLNNQHGALPDLVTVLLHEFGHGLNFQTFYDGTTGVSFGGVGFTDIYAERGKRDLSPKGLRESSARSCATGTRSSPSCASPGSRPRRSSRATWRACTTSSPPRAT
jgi:hypothetical protein